MRQRINFTDEANQFIKNSCENGKSQDWIISELMDKFNIKCSKTMIYKKYKELGLNGDKKSNKKILTPWHDLFTNSTFPDKIANSILYDLSCNWTLKEIADAQHIDIEIIKAYYDKFLYPNITPSVRNRVFRNYKKLFELKDEIDTRNLDEQIRNERAEQVNEMLKGEAHVIANYKKEINGKMITFDFYCPEINKAYIADGVLYGHIINPINELCEDNKNCEWSGFTVKQLNGFTYGDRGMQIFNDNEKAIELFNDIDCIIKGVK